jgi:glycosyltransferase involved in cell wall biosynthesis
MNHDKYVEQCLSSILQQNYFEIEILYVDNCSVDQTFELAEKLLSSSGRRYQVYKRESTYNLPENFNFLIKKGRGDYFLFISGDDWIKKECISGMVNFYEKNTHYGLIYGNGWYYYEDTGEMKKAENDKFISGKIFDHIFLNGVIFPVGIMVKKETFEQVGLFDETIPIEDYDFWLRVAMDYEIGYYNTPNIIYRKHSKSMTGQHGYANIEHYFKIAYKHKSNRLYNRVTRHFRKFTIYHAFINNQKLKTLNLLIKDFRFEKFYLSVLLKLIIGKKG